MALDMTKYSQASRPRGFVGLALLVILGFVLIVQGPFRTVPAGHVGVKDFFGSVSADTLGPGINLVFPLTRVEKMSVQTQEIKEVAEVPSKEGLILYLETSLLFQLDPAKAADIYKTVGREYEFSVARLYARGVRAYADIAERARALGTVRIDPRRN